MDHQQIREIAEAAFKTHFGHIGIVSINVQPGSPLTAIRWWR